MFHRIYLRLIGLRPLPAERTIGEYETLDGKKAIWKDKHGLWRSYGSDYGPGSRTHQGFRKLRYASRYARFPKKPRD